VSHSVPLAIGRKGKDIDSIAFEIVKAFQPNVVQMIIPFDVDRFFECELKQLTGIEPDYQPLGSGLLGYTSIEYMQCIICSNLAEEAKNNDTSRRILRATQAHEIGHCFLHVSEFREARSNLRFQHDDKQASLQLHKQSEIKVYRNPEWQAWRFAGALLMPEGCIRAAVNNKWTLQMMSRGFDVNPAFVKVRLSDLKILDTIRAR
jgi:Zn-dependent peptidase ImmA (M78 family)